MPNIAVGQRLLVTIVGRYFNQTTMNTFLYRCSAVGPSVSDIDAINALDTKLNTAGNLFPLFAACCPGNDAWTSREAWYQVVAPTRYRKVARDLALTPGDYGSQTCNVSGSITRFGDLANRKNVGGIRVPIGTSGCENGLLADNLKGDMDALALILNDLQTTTTPSVVWVPQVGLPGASGTIPPIPGDPMTSVDCTSAVAQGEVRVIRRRTVGLGI